MTKPSHMHSQYRRLTWAHKRLEALREVLDEALDPKSHPIKFTGTFDAVTSDYELSIGTIPEAPCETGVMIGDVLHNLRSALDNAAWRLVQDGDDPTPKDPALVAFPISDSPAKFGKRAKTAVPGVSDRARSVIEAAQPYQDTPVGVVS